MYDGEELFFFPTEVTLSIDGKEYRTLSGASYVSVVGNNTLVYYDYKSEESEVIEIEGKLVEVTSEYIKVNLILHIFLMLLKKKLKITLKEVIKRLMHV